MVDGLEYLVLAHLKKNGRDKNGFHATGWVDVARLDGDLPEADVDAVLAAWEALECKLKAAALAKARAARSAA